MQNHLEITSKSKFWIRSVENWTNICFLMHFDENIVFGLQPTFFYSFHVLLSFLAEKLYRTNMKLPQKASFGSEMCEIGAKVAIWGIRRTGFPPEDSPLFYRASRQTQFGSRKTIAWKVISRPSTCQKNKMSEFGRVQTCPWRQRKNNCDHSRHAPTEALRDRIKLHHSFHLP